MSYASSTPKLASHPSAPHHRAYQHPAAAGLCPGRTQAEAISLLAHLQQTHPVQKVRGHGPGKDISTGGDLFQGRTLETQLSLFELRESPVLEEKP